MWDKDIFPEVPYLMVLYVVYKTCASHFLWGISNNRFSGTPDGLLENNAQIVHSKRADLDLDESEKRLNSSTKPPATGGSPCEIFCSAQRDSNPGLSPGVGLCSLPKRSNHVFRVQTREFSRILTNRAGDAFRALHLPPLKRKPPA
jgi:hypothetical protein